VHGLAVVDKPAGLTSHDVVAEARRRLSERRIGHAGTLDPDATGVLVLGVGSVTRLLRFVTNSTKIYTGEIVLGVETDTLDAAGAVVAVHDMAGVSVDDVRAVVAGHLTGPILQVPPMVSAVKVGGRRLHDLAREGLVVEREPRPVTVERFDVAPAAEPGVFPIEVACSSGTYVRVLVADVGRLLDGGAHLRHLRRTAVGSFTLAESCSLDDLVLLPPEAAVRDLPQLRVDEMTANGVRHGRSFPASLTGPTAVLDEAGRLLAVYEEAGEEARASVVVAADQPG
jgi:tRNA pseudouridine55 synthase